jgi:hypothetical protein
MSTNQHGQLAAQYGEMLPLRVLSSANGFYLGTFSPEDGPVTRESVEYFPTREAADEVFASGSWTQRNHL